MRLYRILRERTAEGRNWHENWNRKFYDQSRMINYEASDYEKYADELKHLRDQLGEMETLKQSVTELEKRVREKSPGRIRQLLQDNAASFLTGTFSGLASRGRC